MLPRAVSRRTPSLSACGSTPAKRAQRAALSMGSFPTTNTSSSRNGFTSAARQRCSGVSCCTYWMRPSGIFSGGNRTTLNRAAPLSGAQAVVEMLRAHGVEVVFGLCGDTSLPLYDALRSGPLRHILTRDERHAAYMADGYARVTGKVGVCEGPSGGGATYILPGLVEANESSIPVLAINTDIAVSSRGRYTLTELDQRALMKPLTKWNAILDRDARWSCSAPPSRT